MATSGGGTARFEMGEDKLATSLHEPVATANRVAWAVDDAEPHDHDVAGIVDGDVAGLGSVDQRRREHVDAVPCAGRGRIPAGQQAHRRGKACEGEFVPDDHSITAALAATSALLVNAPARGTGVHVASVAEYLAART